MSNIDLSYAPAFSVWEAKNIGYALTLFRRYASIFMSRFEWRGLPDGLTSRYIEKTLLFQGQGVFFKDNKYGYLALPCANAGVLNTVFEPTEFYPIGNGFFKKIKTANAQPEPNPESGDRLGVWLRNDMLATPACLEIQRYCERIADVERTIETNLVYHKIPLILVTNDKKVLSMKNFMKDVMNNKPATYVTSAMQTDLKNALIPAKTDVPFIIDGLYDYKNELLAELNSLLGISDATVNKEGGISPVEIESSSGPTVDGYVAAMLESRKVAAEQINKMFPELNVSVELRKGGQKENGKLYNDVAKSDLGRSFDDV